MKKLLALSVVLATAISLAACALPAGLAPANVSQANDSPANVSSAVAEHADQLYVEVSALGSLAYFYDHQLGMKMVGEELGVTTEYVGPADYDMSAMVAAFEQAIAKKPNGIVVVGFEDVLTPIINKAMDAGIPVVTVDADLAESDRICFVGTGNFAAGQSGGEFIAKEMGYAGKIALMTKPGQSNLEERLSGYQTTLAKYPDIEVVQIADTQSDPVVAAQAAATLLQKYPDLKAIACVEAAGGAGAATAVKEAGKAGRVKIMSMDRDADVIAEIDAGVITGSVAQQTALMPYYATQILFNLNNSKVAITGDNKAAGVLGVPNSVDTGSIIITKENAQYFKR